VNIRTLLLSSCAIFTIAVQTAIGQVSIQAERTSQRPLLRPGDSWTRFGLFNPAAIQAGGKTVLLFRAMDTQQTSRIGFAESADGLHFTSRPEPVLRPETAYEAGGGVEDPRLVQIDGVYYLTYTGYNKHDAQLCLATSRDLVHWHREGVILPAYKGNWNTGWTKSGAIVNEKIQGKWWMYYLGTRKDPDGVPRDYMGVANSADLVHWSDASSKPVLERRPNAFDSRVMEPGPPPLLTEAGILLLYNGADEHLVYGPAWVLFDRQNPARLLARADDPFLLPKLDWERAGNVPNVIFLEGAVERAKRVSGTGRSAKEEIELMGYYGGADKYVGAMRIRIAITSHAK
jgi:predicted GH43/DUF377 family glycosyl hydrolase